MQSIQKGLVYLITNDSYGANPELGKILMRAFFNQLSQSELLPEYIIFLNNGVFLSTEGSEVIPNLEFLADQGTTILSCGTCLEFFKMKEKLLVGKPTSQKEIISIMVSSSNFITIA